MRLLKALIPLALYGCTFTTAEPSPAPKATTTPAATSLKIVQIEMTNDEIGSVIIGRVRNNGSNAEWVRVNCDFDYKGRLTDTAGVYTEPTHLATGQVASFRVRSLVKGALSYSCTPSAQ